MLQSLAATARLPAAMAHRQLLHLGGRGGSGSWRGMESVAYHMSMLRAPPVERKKVLTCNSCSLIGRLDAPVCLYDNSPKECPRAYTFLSVLPSSSPSSLSSPNFRVALQFKGDLANVCLRHLKHNDLVYVSGFLSSYDKARESGERYIFHKIYVMELNYVLDQDKKPGKNEESADPSSTPPANTQVLSENKCTDQLRLWQVFFASPYEWWDNRKSKPSISYPDFKHKDTRESLWLRPDDPPWLRKQLELLDLEIAENGRKDGRRLSINQKWKAQDFDYSDDIEVQHSAEG